MTWQVMRPVWDRSSGTPVRTWAPEPGFPLFDDPAVARRAYMTTLMPELTGQTDARIKIHYDAWCRNVRGVKLVRSTCYKT